MKKQLKKLEFKKEQVMSLSAMQSVKGGISARCDTFLNNDSINLMTSVGPMCPTLVQTNTVGC